MKLITEIINDLKKCSHWCCPSIFPLDEILEEDDLQQHLVELPEITGYRLRTPERGQSRKRSASYQEPMKGKQQTHIIAESVHSTNMIRSSGPRQNKQNYLFQSSQMDSQNEKPLVIRRVESGQLMGIERKSSSESSFQTMKSSISRPLSRRNFKILRQSSSFYAKHRSNNEEDFYSVNQSQSSNNNLKEHKIVTFKFSQNNEINRDGIDMMNIWMKKEYQPYPMKFYKPVLSEITKMKLQTKDVFDTMVHKLEDYYTFYFEEQHFEQPENLSRSMSKHYGGKNGGSMTYEEKNRQMVCSVNRMDVGKGFQYEKSCKFISLIIIPHCTLSPLAFLQWFNKLQVQSSLHSFNKIQYLQNSQIIDQKTTLQYPLVRVEQFNQKLMGKQTFILARQIEVARFQNEEDKETLLESCFEVVDEGKCFERLVRVTAEPNDECRVEIYIESSQNIAKRQPSQLLKVMRKDEGERSPEFAYFEQRWKRFEQKLNKNQVINKKAVQVFTN